MEYEKGDHVLLTTQVNEHSAGTKGRVIRVESHLFSSSKYTVLLDDSEQVLEQLDEDDLYSPERDATR